VVIGPVIGPALGGYLSDMYSWRWAFFLLVPVGLVSSVGLRLSMLPDPPLGRAGMTEAEVLRSGRRALVGKIAMEDVSRAFEKGETDGFIKVLVDAESKQILGASFLGTSGDEAVHCVLDAMYAKAPYTVLQRAVHIHPTVAEFIPTLFGGLAPLAE